MKWENSDLEFHNSIIYIPYCPTERAMLLDKFCDHSIIFQIITKWFDSFDI